MEIGVKITNSLTWLCEQGTQRKSTYNYTIPCKILTKTFFVNKLSTTYTSSLFISPKRCFGEQIEESACD